MNRVGCSPSPRRCPVRRLARRPIDDGGGTARSGAPEPVARCAPGGGPRNFPAGRPRSGSSWACRPRTRRREPSPPFSGSVKDGRRCWDRRPPRSASSASAPRRRCLPHSGGNLRVRPSLRRRPNPGTECLTSKPLTKIGGIRRPAHLLTTLACADPALPGRSQKISTTPVPSRLRGRHRGEPATRPGTGVGNFPPRDRWQSHLGLCGHRPRRDAFRAELA